MRRDYILYTLLAIVAIAAGCQKDNETTCQEEAFETRHKIINVAEAAEKGVLAVKLTEESTLELERSVTRNDMTRSGVKSIDSRLDDISAENFSRIFKDSKYEDNLRRFGLHRWYAVHFQEGIDIEQAARTLSLSEGIEMVQYVYLPERPRKRVVAAQPESLDATRNLTSTLPMNDVGLKKQWHYNNDGALEHMVAGADINLFDAWRLCTGDESIVVAVIDEAFNYDHPDLKGNVWCNPDPTESKYLHGANFCVDENSTTWLPVTYDFVDPTLGEVGTHGTHVAGTIAAVNGNNIGVCGVAGGNNGKGGVKVMSCQIFHIKESFFAMANAMIWSANRGAHIAQCSIGYSPILSEKDWLKDYGYEAEAIDYFIELERIEGPISGGLVIFAAGNDGNSIFRGRQVKDQELLQAAYAPIIAVASTAADYTPAGYTSYGDWVDISAPGGEMDFGEQYGIYSTTVDNSYGYLEGTSMACPHVSGVAALGLAYAHKLGKRYSVEEFKSLLLSSGKYFENYLSGPKESAGWNYSTEYYTTVTLNLADYKGKMGGGLIDAYRLLISIEGTPIFAVGLDVECNIPLDELFGSYASNKGAEIEIWDRTLAEQKLGFEGRVIGDKLQVRCNKTGCEKVTLRAIVGESVVERELALVVKESVTQNGGWF